MEFVSIGRVLARHPLLVGASALAAVLVGLLLAFDVSVSPPGINRREAAATTISSARVLIETPRGRAEDLDSQVADTLPLRAQLLAELLMTDVQRARIARMAGLRPRQIAVLGPSTGAPPLPMTPAIRAADAARIPRSPYVLRLLANGQVPIVTIKVTSFDRAGGERLTSAAAKSVENIVASRHRLPGRLAGTLTTQRLGPVTVATTPGTSRAPIALGAALLVFVLLCGAIVVLPALRRLDSGPTRLGRDPRVRDAPV